MSTLSIPRHLYDQLRAHGQQTYPPDSTHNRYHIAPLELVRIEREADRPRLLPHALALSWFLKKFGPMQSKHRPM